MIRYEKECNMLAKLAERQLNLPKNSVKGAFENMSTHSILLKITEEFNELKDELMYQHSRNWNRVLSELGDLTACCAGLLAHINKRREEENDDGG